MAVNNGGIKVASDFQVNVALPMDSKLAVSNLTELYAINFKYQGLVTWVASERKHYKWLGPGAMDWEVLVGDVGLSLVAGASVIAYKVVTTDAAGAAIHADAGTAAHVDQVVGVATNSANTGQAVTVQDSGFLVNPGWSWTQGQPLFLGLNGEIVTTQVGVFSLAIGYAKSATEIFIRVGRGVLRA